MLITNSQRSGIQWGATLFVKSIPQIPVKNPVTEAIEKAFAEGTVANVTFVPGGLTGPSSCIEPLAPTSAELQLFGGVIAGASKFFEDYSIPIAYRMAGQSPPDPTDIVIPIFTCAGLGPGGDEGSFADQQIFTTRGDAAGAGFLQASGSAIGLPMVRSTSAWENLSSDLKEFTCQDGPRYTDGPPRAGSVMINPAQNCPPYVQLPGSDRTAFGKVDAAMLSARYNLAEPGENAQNLMDHVLASLSRQNMMYVVGGFVSGAAGIGIQRGLEYLVIRCVPDTDCNGEPNLAFKKACLAACTPLAGFVQAALMAYFAGTTATTAVFVTGTAAAVRGAVEAVFPRFGAKLVNGVGTLALAFMVSEILTGRMGPALVGLLTTILGRQAGMLVISALEAVCERLVPEIDAVKREQLRQQSDNTSLSEDCRVDIPYVQKLNADIKVYNDCVGLGGLLRSLIYPAEHQLNQVVILSGGLPVIEHDPRERHPAIEGSPPDFPGGDGGSAAPFKYQVATQTLGGMFVPSKQEPANIELTEVQIGAKEFVGIGALMERGEPCKALELRNVIIDEMVEFNEGEPILGIKALTRCIEMAAPVLREFQLIDPRIATQHGVRDLTLLDTAKLCESLARLGNVDTLAISPFYLHEKQRMQYFLAGIVGMPALHRLAIEPSVHGLMTVEDLNVLVRTITDTTNRNLKERATLAHLNATVEAGQNAYVFKLFKGIIKSDLQEVSLVIEGGYELTPYELQDLALRIRNNYLLTRFEVSAPSDPIGRYAPIQQVLQRNRMMARPLLDPTPGEAKVQYQFRHDAFLDSIPPKHRDKVRQALRNQARVLRRNPDSDGAPRVHADGQPVRQPSASPFHGTRPLVLASPYKSRVEIEEIAGEDDPKFHESSSHEDPGQGDDNSVDFGERLKHILDSTDSSSSSI